MTAGRWFGFADAAALAAVGLWGFVVPVIKMALPEIDPVVFVTLRTLLASALIFPIVLTLEHSVEVERKDLGRLALLGLMGMGLTQALYLVGLNYTMVSHSTVLAATAPVFGTILIAWRRTEPVTATRWGGVLLSLLGIALLVEYGQAAFGDRVLAGDLLTVVSAATWASYGVISKPLVRVYSPLKVTAYALAFGNVALVPLGIGPILAQDWAAVSAMGWFALACSVLLGMVAANILWLKSISSIGVTRTAIYQSLIPVASSLVAMVLLGEQLTPRLVVGAAVVLAGTALASW